VIFLNSIITIVKDIVRSVTTKKKTILLLTEKILFGGVGLLIFTVLSKAMIRCSVDKRLNIPPKMPKTRQANSIFAPVSMGALK
jgi:hypothetical protein